MSPPLAVRVSQRAASRLANAYVPGPDGDGGSSRLFDQDSALRYALITYLCQDQALPSGALGTRSAVASLSLSLPHDLWTALEERAAAENRPLATIVRAAIYLAFPPVSISLMLPPGEATLAGPPAPPKRRSLAAALAIAPSGDLAQIFA